MRPVTSKHNKQRRQRLTVAYVATDHNGLTATSTRTVIIEPAAAATSTAQ
jgi:hypothetical protein